MRRPWETRECVCPCVCVYVYFVCAGPVISEARPIQRNLGPGWCCCCCCCLARCVATENGTVSLWVARAVRGAVNEDRAVRCEALAEVVAVNGGGGGGPSAIRRRQLCVNDWPFAVHGGVALMPCSLAVGLRNGVEMRRPRWNGECRGQSGRWGPCSSALDTLFNVNRSLGTPRIFVFFFFVMGCVVFRYVNPFACYCLHSHVLCGEGRCYQHPQEGLVSVAPL